MKSKLLLSLVLVLAFSKARAQGFFAIDGQINNVPKNAVVNLFRDEGGLLRLQATDTITNGAFHFQGKTVDEKTENMVLLARYNDVTSMTLDVWVRPGSRVKVTSDNMLVYTWDVDSDVPEQQTRQRIVGAAREWWGKLQLSNIAEDAIRSMMKVEGISRERAEKLKNSLENFKNKKELITDSIVLAETKAMDTIPVDDVWMDALLGDAYFAETSSNAKCMDAVKTLYDRLPDKWKNTTAGAEIATIVYPYKEINLGDIAADGDLFDLDGNIHHIADFKGKYVLLDFWSVGCGPCMEALPELKELHEAYKDSLEIVSLSLDTDKNWRQAASEHDIIWHNLNDLKGRSGIAAKYNVNTIPLFVLISPNGTIIDKWSGYNTGRLKERLAKNMSRQ